MLTISKNVFLGHSHLLTTSTDDNLIIAQAPSWVIIKMKGHQYLWLADSNDLEIGHF